MRSAAITGMSRSGAWQKMRINRVQDFVIGGYTVGATAFNAVVFSYLKQAHRGFSPPLCYNTSHYESYMERSH
jgi:hypothetical protein